MFIDTNSKRWKNKSKKSKKKRNLKTRKQRRWDYLISKTGKTYKDFLKSEYWKIIKARVMKRDGYKCIICGATENLEIHHNTYKHYKQEYRKLKCLDTLCRKHHNEAHCFIEIK